MDDPNAPKPPVDSTVPAMGAPAATPTEPTATVPTDTTTVPPVETPASTPTMTPEPPVVSETPVAEEKLPEVPTGTGMPGTGTTGGGTV